jgi:hypothetical protein
MAVLRAARLGAVTGPGRGGVDAPRRSTTATTEPAMMVVASVPATSSSASERRHSAGAAGGGSPGVLSRASTVEAGAVRKTLGGRLRGHWMRGPWRAVGSRSPTHTPNGGG